MIFVIASLLLIVDYIFLLLVLKLWEPKEKEIKEDYQEEDSE